ncbi:DUF2634 domain-containing protein [Agathobaculum sp. NTUH-O15-33]|uniref:DUF2634 domain-containing protein n=1 Tax=Agathobaculum sp. NTUH-O15-33 TaxID=3079302 RepID=UPI00295859BC|nr:DUF2634 domain-containing protein [Agathobaculum sp. NTUH-O15-33]WNX85795.1 DUF2634 domain-containing protein [Agathobaculum sp. NTUH-O15-33]
MAEQNIFPYLQPTAATAAAELPVMREVAWDFDKDAPILRGGVPVMVEREQAVLVWAWNALHTERFRWACFSPAYGNETPALIGQTYQPETKRAEVQRYIEECLMACPYIKAVSGVTVETAGDMLLVTAGIVSVYGEIKMEVEQIVG